MNKYVESLLIASVISVCASSLVIITILGFKSLRHKQLVRIVLFISIGDLLGNIPYITPYRPYSGNWWCNATGFLNLAGYPISWLWTVVLCYYLYSLGSIGKLPSYSTRLFVEVMSALLPIVLAFISRIFSPFVRVGDIEVCAIDSSPDSTIVHFATYYGLWLLCLLAMAVMLGRLSILTWQHDVNVTSKQFRRAKQTLQFYPTLLFIFWFPHLLTEFIEDLDYSDVNYIAYHVCLVWKVLHGLATAIVFFSNSSLARKKWYRLYLRTFYPSMAVNDLTEQSQNNDLEAALNNDDDNYDDDDETRLTELRVSQMFSRSAAARQSEIIS